jgi:hypothetical protein
MPILAYFLQNVSEMRKSEQKAPAVSDFDDDDISDDIADVELDDNEVWTEDTESRDITTEESEYSEDEDKESRKVLFSISKTPIHVFKAYSMLFTLHCNTAVRTRLQEAETMDESKTMKDEDYDNVPDECFETPTSTSTTSTPMTSIPTTSTPTTSPQHQLQ